MTGSGVLTGLAQIFDLYSDIAMTYVIYWASQKNEDPSAAGDYQVAIAICFISIVATFMA